MAPDPVGPRLDTDIFQFRLNYRVSSLLLQFYPPARVSTNNFADTGICFLGLIAHILHVLWVHGYVYIVRGPEPWSFFPPSLILAQPRAEPLRFTAGTPWLK